METGRTPAGKRPIIEKSVEVYSNILDGTATDQEPKFPMREAYEIAHMTVESVLFPPSAAHDGPAGVLAHQNHRLRHEARPHHDLKRRVAPTTMVRGELLWMTCLRYLMVDPSCPCGAQVGSLGGAATVESVRARTTSRPNYAELRHSGISRRSTHCCGPSQGWTG
eukprot:1848962-Pyramimonas_sp.AAC.1